ncbi:hypothetical protein QTP70_004389 [Hemibagrus guttatus]|uniref:Uncharacterized protein n=1 Tax=Hemibagrus guttatus TaxID=175788 RepID=A0AAE0PTU7_9TELE|nr:hypothetical protein QTP70_004389 [Hemibagrus guttatus]
MTPCLSKAVVDHTEDPELVRALLAAMDFIFIIDWVLTTRECRAVGKLLNLSDSKLKLTLKPKAISLRGARLLFRHITHLQKLCSNPEIFRFLSSCSSLLNIWTIHCVNLTECRTEAQSLISLMCHPGHFNIRLNPSVVLLIIREIYETGSAHCVSSLLNSTHNCINLNNTELDSNHCTALCFTLQHYTSVSLILLWTSIPEGELVKILPLFNRISQLSVDRSLLLKILHCCSISELQQGAAAAVFSALQNRLDFSCSTGLDLGTETQDNTLHLTTENCRDISTAIQKSQQCTELILEDCELEDTGVDMFFLILHTVADDTTVIGLIQDGDESAYRQEVEQLAVWCSHNNLDTLKTMEMIVDFRRNPPALHPHIIMDSSVAAVESFKFKKGRELADMMERRKVGCELEEKEIFWSELDEVMESIPTGERVVIGVDFNGHVGEGNTGDEEVMGKFGVKERNLEGQMVVDFAKRMDMAVVNTYFQKREEHRVTYKSGGRRTQVDYILCRRSNLKEISDCKVVVGESVARQHRMVVCRMTLMVCKTKRAKIEKKTKWWKLKKEECCEEFRQTLRQALGGQVVLPDDWETTAEVIRETGRKVLGVSSGRRKEDKETWWWNEEVQNSIQRKRLAKKKRDMDRTEENRQEYKALQRRVKREVSKAKQKAYDELYTRLDTREREKDLYRLARQRDRDGKDVQQVRVIKDRDGRVLTSEESVQRRWKEYFEELMNEENEREKRVEGVNSVEQKVDKIRKDEVRKALKRLKSGKAVGPDDIPVEVWKCLGEAAVG